MHRIVPHAVPGRPRSFESSYAGSRAGSTPTGTAAPGWS